MRLLFVINPASGRSSNDDAVMSIQEAAVRDGFELKFFYTTGKGDDEAIKQELKNFRPDRVAACGGDGTVQLVAKSLMKTGVPMAILPLGSANGLATALEIPSRTEEALSVAVHSKKTRPLDFLKINDEYTCIHLSDIGTNALLVKNYEESGDKGMIGYARHLLSSIKQSDLMRYIISTPESVYEKEGYMLMIANANRYGTGIRISEGSVSDGRFEICNVRSIDLESAIKAGLTALNVFIDKDMFSDVISCRYASIKIDRKAHLQIDGEYMGEFDNLTVKIIDSPINVIVERDA